MEPFVCETNDSFGRIGGTCGFSIFFYGKQDISWLYFFILLFAPDLSLLGYLLNKKVGTVS